MFLAVDHPPPATDPEPPRRWPRWLIRLATATVLAVTFALDRSGFLVVPLLFAIVVPFEKLFPRHRGQRVRRPLVGLDVRYALLNPVLSGIGIVFAVVVGVASLAWLPGLLLRPVIGLLPGWANVTLAIALFDMLGYWAHRWMHEVPQLWRFHAIHHSTEHLDWVSGFRLHPLDGIVIAPPVFFLLAAGIAPAVVGALAAVQIVVGIFLHANVRWQLRPLHRIVATPEFHHWHHANEAGAHCSNYAGIFPIWDSIFGTYRVPRNIRPLRYGVDEDVPNTLRGQLRFPVAALPPARALARHPWRALRSAIGGARAIATGVRRSTTRPRRPYPRPGEPWPWATVPPLGHRRD